MITPGALLFGWIVVVCFTSATIERAAELEREAFIGPPTEETVNSLLAEAQYDREFNASMKQALVEGAAEGLGRGIAEGLIAGLFSGH